MTPLRVELKNLIYYRICKLIIYILWFHTFFGKIIKNRDKFKI